MTPKMHAVSPYPTLACSLALLCAHTHKSINIIVKPQEKMLQKGTYLKMIKAPWSHLRKPQLFFFHTNHCVLEIHVHLNI